MSQRVKIKRSCCQSRPRCQRCPVVLKRLDKAGQAQRIGQRTYVVSTVTKRDMKAARSR
jgi:hypothetical protein